MEALGAYWRWIDWLAVLEEQHGLLIPLVFVSMVNVPIKQYRPCNDWAAVLEKSLWAVHYLVPSRQ